MTIQIFTEKTTRIRYFMCPQCGIRKTENQLKKEHNQCLTCWITGPDEDEKGICHYCHEPIPKLSKKKYSSQKYHNMAQHNKGCKEKAKTQRQQQANENLKATKNCKTPGCKNGARKDQKYCYTCKKIPLPTPQVCVEPNCGNVSKTKVCSNHNKKTKQPIPRLIQTQIIIEQKNIDNKIAINNIR